MLLTLRRRPSLGGATIGTLHDSSKVGAAEFLCYTLEDEIREQEGVPVAVWKIKGATAIPAGRYRITLEQSPRFGPDTITINGVPGFVAIRMHAGNTSGDTEGCPLTGMAVTANSIVGGTSGPALKLVKERIKAAIARGESVWIEVQNPTVLA